MHGIISIPFLFQRKFICCRAPTKALLFCMNQFPKFHHLELRNLILTYFKTKQNLELQNEVWELFSKSKRYGGSER